MYLPLLSIDAADYALDLRRRFTTPSSKNALCHGSSARPHSHLCQFRQLRCPSASYLLMRDGHAAARLLMTPLPPPPPPPYFHAIVYTYLLSPRGTAFQMMTARRREGGTASGIGLWEENIV